MKTSESSGFICSRHQLQQEMRQKIKKQKKNNKIYVFPSLNTQLNVMT